MIRDLRKYAQQTQVRLFVGFIVLLFIIGDGLIYLIYGRQAALLGLVCMLAGLAPIVLISLVLWGMDWLVHHTRDKEDGS